MAGIGFTELSNGFATCTDPAGLQAICDQLGPDQIQAFFDRWTDLLPLPLDAADRQAGYWWELSMRQIETSRTMVFDAAAPGPGVLRGVGRRQPRRRPARSCRADLRRPPAPVGTATEDRTGLQDPDRHPRHHRGHGERRLQALPGQAVPQRRPGAADRDRHQLTPTTSAANAASSTWPSCRPKPVPSTPACSILNVSGRAVSWRAQPLSGSPNPPSPRMAGGRPDYGSEILGSWPCSAPSA